MRGFFILLLIANLLLAGWFYWQVRTHEEQEISISQKSSQEQLSLLSELPPGALQPIPLETAMLPQAPKQDNATASPNSSDSEPGTVGEAVLPEKSAVTCVRFAPLPNVAAVESLTRKLAQANLAVLGSGEGVTERETYWVMIAPYKSEKEARNVASQLAKAKVRDFLLIRSGEFVNGISLGLFSQKQGAESRLHEIIALNLKIRKPEIRPRTSSVRSHWLVARVSGDEALKTLQRQLEQDGVQSSPVACPP